MMFINYFASGMAPCSALYLDYLVVYFLKQLTKIDTIKISLLYMRKWRLREANARRRNEAEEQVMQDIDQ